MTLKEQLFNKSTVEELVTSIKKVFKEFEGKQFLLQAIELFKEKELKERITVLNLLLKQYLPDDYIETTEILKQALKESKGGFVYGSFLEYVEYNGCTEEHIDYSLTLLEAFTQSFSAEFVIRRFLNEFENKTYEACIKWSKSNNVDVRRLASEGLRPKLPWAVGINIDYKKAAIPLDNLYYDTERYVTRSVANHLNDISKIDPQFVLNTLKKWKKTKLQNKKEMDYIINHSLRTLIKKGHKDTLSLLGFNSKIQIDNTSLLLTSPNIKIGDNLEFDISFDSISAQDLIIDYKIIYPSSNKKQVMKVYKLKILNTEKQKTYVIHGKRSFKEISTRSMKTGEHQIVILVNGNEVASKKFFLKG